MPTGKTASTPDAHELRAWLRLAHTKGLKPLALRALLGAFGGPLEVLSESFASLTEAADARAAEAVLAPPSGIEGVPFDHYIEAVLAWASEPGNHVLTFADAAYP
ncbi:DNA protecting protein DprA [Caballeronia cordobensis]|uniref:DNA protecting protein DprA n=1 Tax=Caballeronia cordobensis TaxID=1353886 RepID=A0A158F3G1_CABCO|nr:DNA protecting protein DprA [Caballeronia cordobensis]